MTPGTGTLYLYPGTWHVQYSSRDLWHGKRNGHANFTDTKSLKYTYQEINTVEIKSHQELSWEVVGSGKDGKLESWMKETEVGIEDTSGELLCLSILISKVMVVLENSGMSGLS
jgi:hypothetical protein